MAKRANGEGTLAARKDKTGKVVNWRAGIMVGRLEDGSPDRRWVCGKTQREVRDELQKLQGQQRGGTLSAHEVPTLSELFEEWLTLKKQQGRAVNTLEDYTLTFRHHLLPKLGRTRIDKLVTRDIESCILSVVKDVSPAAARRALTKLSQCLNQAIKWGYIARNLTSSVEAPRVPTAEMQVWEMRQASEFLTSIRAHRLYPLFYVALVLGLRSGELRGLRWQDLDFKEGWLAVRQGAVDQPKGDVQLSPLLKTDKSRRRIKLDATVMATLLEHRDKQNVEREAIQNPRKSLLERRMKQGWNPQYAELDLVFASEKGTPISGSNLNREFEKLTRLAQVPRIRIHDLRHTAATALIRGGYPPKLVADILGHKDPGFTLKKYVHVWESQREGSAPSAAALYAYAETPSSGPSCDAVVTIGPNGEKLELK